MSVAVVVPWRPTDEHRVAAWRWVRARWEELGYEAVEGQCPDGEWSKGAAVADGLARTAADIVVVADADVWSDGVALAVDAVAGGAAWAIPHWWVRRLTPEATAAVLAGGPIAGDVTRRPYVGFAGGGVTVIRRHLLDAAPIDPRFKGWGQEDQAAALAWRTLGGEPWRGTADLWHLWHPPQPRMSIQWGSAENRSLWRRYLAAHRRPAVMATLIAEQEALLCPSA